ncbi:hypothetical protein COW36_08835 [bacterium (Candidatus Blackallbacteria) CG17_big_fil_post_rev_8_21_14_2_50_48_46]|uniref:DUF155 domain-containing protein n=1 Tax=bacterium (Candidatus Blackallbacteria) CG17_big_fil_post_rev_8_21_14_2_50_48_46 TaxID=2014261 RepID=A0A2M7G6D1_9BACT|nr:MAG: hypothetical protein COW64_06135 [bacterium (Candidatus Blackallbacteria) CG18_big_fil_WC_8_21_14_2_50_49_26]PIW17590.1 MAG: hypothetical protein COW36_08835 [bacterium (Candidatus Blackallbacteria) CG17_big_fil_post_rev_8_21_14_2_50_48_46]PIW48445.1 MAG: hypothetical protein COW20_10185 [bacterium (Candidatus Blackallbacteria) CG13_big_fil_rev_8_21_14_2_50_49_14]
MNAPLGITQGKILVYYQFDLADSVDLETLRHKWVGRSSSIKLVSRRSSPSYLQFKTEPLLLPMGAQKLQLSQDRWLDVEVRAKVFEFGVVSIAWELPFPDTWQTAVQEANLYIDSHWIADQSEKLLADLMPALAPALIKPYPQQMHEDYTIFYVYGFENPELSSSEAILKQLGSDIAGMVRGESKKLADSERQTILSQKITYFEDDLVVVAWNSSFIFDPEGSSEHVDILEFANVELLELRSYDKLLDQQLEGIYDELENQPMSRGGLFKNPYHHTIQKLMTLLLDVTELTDRIENTLKIIGDLYCARIYRMISTLLQLRDWQARVDGKLESARQIYETLNDEVQNRRSTIMEIIIILMIGIEIILALMPAFKH